MLATLPPFKPSPGILIDSCIQELSRKLYDPDEDARRRAGQPTTAAPAPLPWTLASRLIDDQPFTLDQHEPLRQLYADDHPHIVVIKPAQVGVSEWAISRTCWTLVHGASYWKTGKAGLNVAYIFPSKDALGDFSKERLSGLQWVDGTPPLFTEYDDVTFKQAGQSYLYLRGGNSESGLLSFPVDVLILDEFDRMTPKARSLARKRLRASLVKREIDISTPTLPGRGIHAEYLRSDQQVWEVQCDGCGVYSELDFFRDVRVNGADYDTWKEWTEPMLRDATITVTCPACHADVNRCGPGRWTPRQPSVSGIRGYWIPALSFPSVSLLDLCLVAISTDPTVTTELYRSGLGLPYEPAGSRITDAMMQQVVGSIPVGPWRQTTMGVDVGARYHYRIDSTGPDGMRYVRAMGAVRSYSDLDALMKAYAVRQVVIDALPELNSTRDWAARHPGKVLRAFYPGDNATMRGELFLVKEDEPVIQINRTMAMDAVYTAVADVTETWPASIVTMPEVLAHLQAPIRVEYVDKHGQLRAQWVHTRPDHFFHASVYARVAFAALPKSSLAGVGVVQGKAKGWGN